MTISPKVGDRVTIYGDIISVDDKMNSVRIKTQAGPCVDPNFGPSIDISRIAIFAPKPWKPDKGDKLKMKGNYLNSVFEFEGVFENRWIVTDPSGEFHVIRPDLYEKA